MVRLLGLPVGVLAGSTKLFLLTGVEGRPRLSLPPLSLPGPLNMFGIKLAISGKGSALAARVMDPKVAVRRTACGALVAPNGENEGCC